MKITDIKISVRLGACFAALIAVMCVIAMVAVKNLGTVSAVTDEIVNDRYAKVALGNQITDKVNTAARALRNAIIAPDQATTEKYLERAANSTRDVTEQMADLEKRLNMPRARELFEKLKEARAEYAKPRNKILELLRQQKKNRSSRFALQGSDSGSGQVSCCAQGVCRLPGLANGSKRCQGQ